MNRRALLTGTVGVVCGLVLTAAGLVALGVALILFNARTPTPPTGKVPIEFRILADRRRDHVDISGPDGPGDAPDGYRWVKLDRRSGLEADPDLLLRDGPGAGERSVLVKLDRYNVSEKHMADIYAEVDEHLSPAIGFRFDRTGADLFGDLTRSHLPDEDRAFRYRLAIIVDHAVMTAPSINSEIRDRGIIEGGGQGFTPQEVARLISRLTK